MIPDTIAALVTPPGVGGVGIVRVAGPAALFVARSILFSVPEPRLAGYRSFLDANGDSIDDGLAIYFPGPNSFTGDDILELQGHGGPVVLDNILSRVLSLGARLARPGEFTERAFLNGKIDLTQAEAIADLVESGSQHAARLAVRTLRGEFSRRIHELLERLIELRVYVESCIDFPDEDIEFLTDKKLFFNLKSAIETVKSIINSAYQGQLLRDGINLVISGRPNAGKSSLMNALAESDIAIVTHVPGTTRDILRERIHIDGLPLHIVDTAGLRDVKDLVELEGIRRAREEIANADRILWVYDDNEDPCHDTFVRNSLPPNIPITLVRNKIDLTDVQPGMSKREAYTEIALSAKNGSGMDILREHLKQCVGYKGVVEGEFIARRRHLNALERSSTHLSEGMNILHANAGGELLAEELRLAQLALGEITGEFLPDDLLREIFSRFCIGK